jgi:asparagine synthase (glutamine-hydrolysing)
MVRDALTNDAARARGLYRKDTVDGLLAAPNQTRTTLDANALWQLAVLEMWLQSMES